VTITNFMGACRRHFHWNSSRQIGRNSAKKLHDNNHENLVYVTSHRRTHGSVSVHRK